eukprot:jgi/Ulvmu1/6194/UM028_0050.1
MPGGYRGGGNRGGGRYGGYQQGGRNSFQGYRGDPRGRGGGGGRGGNYRGGSARNADQHPGIAFVWNLPTEHKSYVRCMAFVGGTLYVGLDDGTIKIYNYNDDPSKKNRFVPAELPEVRFPNCSARSILTLDSNVYVAMVCDSGEPGASKLHCPNTQQDVPVPGKIEQAALCTRAQAETPSIWAATTNGTLAVISLAPADAPAPQGTIVMTPKAELNLDRSAHQGAINRVTEVFCAPANTSVLISGDMLGALVVWNICTGTVIQRVPVNAAQPSDNAVTGICEYKGTHFIVSFFSGVVHVFQFAAQPVEGQAVNPVPLASYSPPSLAPSGFGAAPPRASGVLAIALTYGPAKPSHHGDGGEVLDWLVVSRMNEDALEVVQLDPSFPWGGGLTQTTMSRCILPVEVQVNGTEERLVLAGSATVVKIFRWKTNGFVQKA